MTSAPGAGVDVVQLAREAYQRGWSRTVDVSASTRESQAISRDWQSRVRAADGARFADEVRVSAEFRERIDLIDYRTATAYEMKVSGKNPTHEFFKDVFKVLEHNLSGGGRIKRLVFLTDGAGVARLQSGLCRSLLTNSHDLGFEIKLEPLD
jgi:hypothetical protein